MINQKNIDSILSYYQSRVDAMSSYSAIIWNRFNWFMLAQGGLIGFYLTLLEKFQDRSILLVSVMFFGSIISIVNIRIGYLDNDSHKRHKIIIRDLSEAIHRYFEYDPKEDYPDENLQEKLDIKIAQRKLNWLNRQTSTLIVIPWCSLVIWIILLATMFFLPEFRL
jgi:hypothetical protein